MRIGPEFKEKQCQGRESLDVGTNPDGNLGVCHACMSNDLELRAINCPAVKRGIAQRNPFCSKDSKGDFAFKCAHVLGTCDLRNCNSFFLDGLMKIAEFSSKFK